MAMAVQKLFPEAQTTIGPWIDRGFYYDFDLPTPLSSSDLKAVKKEMQKIIKANLPFICEEVRDANDALVPQCKTASRKQVIHAIGACVPEHWIVPMFGLTLK